MKFKNETAEKLYCHEDRPGGMRETIWVKPGAVVDLNVASPKYGEDMGLTFVPEEAPAEKAPKEEVKAEEGKVGETVVETKQKKPARSKRKK